MTYVIPNQFRTRQDTVRLALLDENFSSVAQQINNIEVVLGLGAGSGVATTLQFGLVKPDGTSILVTSGVISANIQTATLSNQGISRPNNSSIVVNSGVLSLGSSITANWTIEQSSNGTLYFYYAGVDKFRLGTNGSLTFPDGTVQSTAPTSIGVGQTWQSVTRAFLTNYTNSTGKPIMLAAWFNRNSVSTANIDLIIGGVQVPLARNTNSNGGNASAGSLIIPDNTVYQLVNVGEGLSSYQVYELR